MEERKLEGKTFVISGVLSKTRDEIKMEIEQHGGRVVGAISAKTNYFLIGENVGRYKLRAALNHGQLEMISESEFRSII